jgi:molybdopterin/thiamine biosynthesis adenylyltransferase
MGQPEELNDQQLLQYSRQIMLPDFGVEGQQALAGAHVMIIGAGGLGSPAAMYLAAAGVGELSIADFDTVDETNLQRQILHSTQQLGMNKAVSAKQQLAKLNPGVQVNCIDHKLDDEQLLDAIDRCGCVIDASDNFATRFMVNRACYATRTPLVSAAAIQYQGQLCVFDSRHPDSACYACLYSEQGEDNTNCSENGILGPVVGIMGSMQALEAIKILCNIGEPSINRLQLFDARSLQWRTMKLKKDSQCPICGQ